MEVKLSIRLDDGTLIRASFDEAARRFTCDKAEFEAKHDILKLLKIEGVQENKTIHVSYIFDADYEPRHFYFSRGGSLHIEDYVELITPKSEKPLQRIVLILESAFDAA